MSAFGKDWIAAMQAALAALNIPISSARDNASDRECAVVAQYRSVPCILHNVLFLVQNERIAAMQPSKEPNLGRLAD